jgi:hypothetical protein
VAGTCDATDLLTASCQLVKQNNNTYLYPISAFPSILVSGSDGIWNSTNPQPQIPSVRSQSRRQTFLHTAHSIARTVCVVGHKDSGSPLFHCATRSSLYENQKVNRAGYVVAERCCQSSENRLRTLYTPVVVKNVSGCHHDSSSGCGGEGCRCADQW